VLSPHWAVIWRRSSTFVAFLILPAQLGATNSEGHRRSATVTIRCFSKHLIAGTLIAACLCNRSSPQVISPPDQPAIS